MFAFRDAHESRGPRPVREKAERLGDVARDASRAALEVQTPMRPPRRRRGRAGRAKVRVGEWWPQSRTRRSGGAGDRRRRTSGPTSARSPKRGSPPSHPTPSGPEKNWGKKAPTPAPMTLMSTSASSSGSPPPMRLRERPATPSSTKRDVGRGAPTSNVTRFAETRQRRRPVPQPDNARPPDPTPQVRTGAMLHQRPPSSGRRWSGWCRARPECRDRASRARRCSR